MKDPRRKIKSAGTWTIRPDEDVKKVVTEFLKENSGYDRSKIINEALRLRLPEAIASLLRQDIAKLEARLMELKRSKPLNSLKNAKAKILCHVLARAGELAQNKRR